MHKLIVNSVTFSDTQEWKKIMLAWACDMNGPPAHNLSSVAVCGRFQGLREVQVVRIQTGGAQLTRTC